MMYGELVSLPHMCIISPLQPGRFQSDELKVCSPHPARMYVRQSFKGEGKKEERINYQYFFFQHIHASDTWFPNERTFWISASLDRTLNFMSNLYSV